MSYKVCCRSTHCVSIAANVTAKCSAEKPWLRCLSLVRNTGNIQGSRKRTPLCITLDSLRRKFTALRRYLDHTKAQFRLRFEIVVDQNLDINALAAPPISL